MVRGAALDTVHLSREIPLARMRDESAPGIHVIPLDDNDLIEASLQDAAGLDIIEEPPDTAPDEVDFEDPTVLELADPEEIPLPAPRAIGMAAAAALAATPLFAGLSGEVLETLVEHMEIIALDAGQQLFREGEPSDALYVIVEGELAVVAEGVETQRLGPGAFLGEVALLTDQLRSSTVAAVTESELLRIDGVTLSLVLHEHGDMLRAVLRFVRDRLVDRWMPTSPLFRPFDDAQRASSPASSRSSRSTPGRS